MNVEKLLTLLPSQRHLVRLKPRRRGRYRSRKREKLTEEALVSYLETNKIRKICDLKRLRANNPNTPYLVDFISAFKSWKAAVEKAFGKDLFNQPPDNSPHYMITCCTHKKLWTQSQWMAARRRNPELIPSSRQVRRVWGGFGNMFFAAMKESPHKTFDDYLRLEQKLGHLPSVMDCRDAGLDLTALRRLLGNKWQLTDLLKYRRRPDDDSQKP